MTAEQIAHVCHETSRAMSAVQGNTDIQAWNDLHPAERVAATAGVQGIINDARVLPRCQHQAYQRQTQGSFDRLRCCEAYFALPEITLTTDKIYNMLTLVLK